MKGRKKIIKKGWGREIVWADEDGYCGKILEFDREGAEFSTHFHAIKDETWLVLRGLFRVEWVDTEVGETRHMPLLVDDIWRNPPLVPHRLIALEPDSAIMEVSTRDRLTDNYRVRPGDSQKIRQEKPSG